MFKNEKFLEMMIFPRFPEVGDLGVSKLCEEFDQNHTRVGTPLYLAPEQVKHQG